VEGYALRHEQPTAARGASPLLRMASDERLVALTRRGNQAAFEVIVARYQARLLPFCARIVGSREDAEDVLQEVFAASFNALLADDREINLRPWLYRIARNRSLNQLRRHKAIGVDSMDVHFAEMGISTSEKVLGRENFRQLLADIVGLPESQRTALLLREIEGMSYEQIAVAMEQTVPGIKSLLVRARIGLAEAGEARKLTCEDVRLELGSVAEGIGSLTQPARRHLRSCERCSAFRVHLRSTNRALTALAPFGPLLLLKHFLAAKLGLGSAGGGAAAGGAAAAGGGAAVGGGTAGAITATAIATKAAAVVAAAAIVAAGAVATVHPRHAAATTTKDLLQGEPATLPAAAIAAASRSAGASHRYLAVRTNGSGQAGMPAPAVGATVGPSGASTAPATQEVTTTTVFPGATAGPTGVTGNSPTSLATTTTGTAASTTAGVGASGASGAEDTGASGTTGATADSGLSGPTGTTAP